MEAGPHLEVQQFACLTKSILRIILQASKDPSWVSEGSGLTKCGLLNEGLVLWNKRVTFSGFGHES